MSETKLIVIQAAPSVRTMCPAAYIEGEWRDVPACIEKIEFGTLPQLPQARTINTGDMALEEVTLVARPTGRMARRQSDGATARVWEVRRPADWRE